MTAPLPLIEIRRLCKQYREGEAVRVVLDHLDLEIRQREVATLLGSSGSGKSTLLNLISGIDLADSGEIHIDGCDLGAMRERERTYFRRRHIGFVFQFFNLIPTLTVEENLLLPLELNRMTNPTCRRQALALLDRIGLGARRDSFPERLSGGEQQRLAIGRALAHKPALLLADEPTGNLDSETGQRILDLLLDLPRQIGATVVIVTHNREIAVRTDRTFLLEGGRVKEVSIP